MIDLHLISLAFAGFGIAAGAAIVIAVSIIAIAAVSRHRTGAARTRLTIVRPRHPATASPASHQSLAA